MKKSYWYGKLIYAKNLEELENNWNEVTRHMKIDLEIYNIIDNFIY